MGLQWKLKLKFSFIAQEGWKGTGKVLFKPLYLLFDLHFYTYVQPDGTFPPHFLHLLNNLIKLCM